MNEISCPICGRAFEFRSGKIYCSKRCSKRAGKRRASLRGAVYCDYVCPICGETGRRRKTKNRVTTCGRAECVKRHKKNVKKEGKKRWIESGKNKACASYKKKYRRPVSAENRKYDQCVCGGMKKKGSELCFRCITNQKKITLQVILCRECGKEFRQLVGYQKFCCAYCKNKNKDRRFRARNPEWHKNYYGARDQRPDERLKHSVRSRIRDAIRGASIGKTKKTFDMLGYTPEELMEHLQNRFMFGMNWANYGTEWHVDHIKPVFMFKIENQNDIKRVWSLSNLAPRWATNRISARYGGFQEGNIEKGARYVG